MNEKLPFLVIGHRGCAGVEPENTLRAVEAALDAGCKMIEIDVHLVEGELVVIHDFSVNRTTNGMGDLCDMELSYLRSLDAGSGQEVPFLRDVLDLCNRRATVNIELKGANTAGAVVMLIYSRWEADDVVVSSFDWEMLKRVRIGNPNVPIAVLVDDAAFLDQAISLAQELEAIAVNPSLEVLTKDFVERAHSAGLKVNVFTVRSEEEARRVIDSGADACFADDPAMVLEMV